MPHPPRIHMKPHREPFSFANPPGLFAYVSKAFEYHTKPLNQMIMSNMIEERIKKTIDKLYNHNIFKCVECGFRFQHHYELKEHLDYHFQKNILAIDKTKCPKSR